MKGCLERGPRRPTRPIQPADSERSEVGGGGRREWRIRAVESATQTSQGNVSKAATSFRLHVEADAQVTAGLEEPVVGGGGDVEGQPALLTCSH